MHPDGSIRTSPYSGKKETTTRSSGGGGSSSAQKTAYYDESRKGIVTSDGKFYPTSNKNYAPIGYSRTDIPSSQVQRAGTEERPPSVVVTDSGQAVNYATHKIVVDPKTGKQEVVPRVTSIGTPARIPTSGKVASPYSGRMLSDVAELQREAEAYQMMTTGFEGAFDRLSGKEQPIPQPEKKFDRAVGETDPRRQIQEQVRSVGFGEPVVVSGTTAQEIATEVRPEIERKAKIAEGIDWSTMELRGTESLAGYNPIEAGGQKVETYTVLSRTGEEPVWLTFNVGKYTPDQLEKNRKQMLSDLGKQYKKEAPLLSEAGLFIESPAISLSTLGKSYYDPRLKEAKTTQEYFDIQKTIKEEKKAEKQYLMGKYAYKYAPQYGGAGLGTKILSSGVVQTLGVGVITSGVGLGMSGLKIAGTYPTITGKLAKGAFSISQKAMFGAGIIGVPLTVAKIESIRADKSITKLEKQQKIGTIFASAVAGAYGFTVGYKGGMQLLGKYAYKPTPVTETFTIGDEKARQFKYTTDKGKFYATEAESKIVGRTKYKFDIQGKKYKYEYYSPYDIKSRTITKGKDTFFGEGVGRAKGEVFRLRIGKQKPIKIGMAYGKQDYLIFGSKVTDKTIRLISVTPKAKTVFVPQKGLPKPGYTYSLGKTYKSILGQEQITPQLTKTFGEYYGYGSTFKEGKLIDLSSYEGAFENLYLNKGFVFSKTGKFKIELGKNFLPIKQWEQIYLGEKYVDSNLLLFGKRDFLKYDLGSKGVPIPEVTPTKTVTATRVAPTFVDVTALRTPTATKTDIGIIQEATRQAFAQEYQNLLSLGAGQLAVPTGLTAGLSVAKLKSETRFDVFKLTGNQEKMVNKVDVTGLSRIDTKSITRIGTKGITRIDTSTLSRVGTRSISRQISQQATRLKTLTGITPIIAPTPTTPPFIPEIPVPPEIIIPPDLFGDIGISAGKQLGIRTRGKEIKDFAPSPISVLFNIRGKQRTKGYFTGFEIRKKPSKIDLRLFKRGRSRNKR